jgi:4-azaleucine resistance transporter AzlC
MNGKKDFRSLGKALKAAFPRTVPVLFGYVFMGAAFGILMAENGWSVLWPVLMSVFVYAGSMQFVAAGLLAGPFDPLGAAVLTLTVNARHLFYGLSMVGRFESCGKKKPYMIFSLTDETYSLLCSAKAPKDVDEGDFLFFISLLDQLYWVAGSALGGLLGSVLPINTKGLDFVMTALFTVIFTEQWLSSKNHIPAVTGVGVAALCLLAFGPADFVIPSMLVILAVLTFFRKPTERGEKT